MKKFKLFFAVALALALCLTAGAASAEEIIYSHLGETMPDFSVTTIDGGTFTLSEALAEKEMVLINLWATWCGPCEMEFPYLEEAYEQYQDRVEVIALSVESEDTDEVLTAYAKEHGMTFKVGNESGLGLGETFAGVGIPTSVVVDRFGVVTFIEIGSQPSTSAFTRLFDAFIGEDYTESLVFEELPPARPSVEAASEEALNEALNVEGGTLVFTNPTDKYTWPMIPAEDGEHTALTSTNAGGGESTSSVLTNVLAAEGDALAFELRTSTEAAMDLLTVSVDGETVKSFGGEHAWTEWAIALPAGEHEIAFSYEKDWMMEEGEDAVWLDNVRIVSGDEAAALLAALPVYPTAQETTFTVLNENAKEIVFEDPRGILMPYFACGSYWIVPDEMAEAMLCPDASLDPETGFFSSNYDGQQTPIIQTLEEGSLGYIISTGIDSMDTSGYSYTNLYFYPSVHVETAEEIYGIMFFRDEANVNALVGELADANLSWSYADGTLPSTGDVAEGEAAGSVYTVKFVDQNDAPVPGCIINFCTDEACVPTVADENGVAVFEGAPYAYHLQVIKVPEGYEFDTKQEFYAEPEGGELTFVVTKK